MARLYSAIGITTIAIFNGANTNYLVCTAAGVWYSVFIVRTIAGAAGNVVFSKSTDGGVSWSAATTVSAQAGITQLSVWYDRWSNISAGLIHCAFTNSVNSDCNYRSINTESSDTLSTETVIFAGASVLAGGALSICRARGGNLYCQVAIDAGTESQFSRSVDVGANWTVRANGGEAATQDQWLLAPGWAADNQDMMMFFWDASADEISRKLYDDSADSWAETSIATAMVDTPAATNGPHWAATVDITNSQNLVAAWNGVDTANADLRMFKVTEAAITEVTNVVANGTDDQAMCAISIDTSTEDWYAFYAGKSDGAETWNTSVLVYYKKSTDDGATWGAETALTPAENGYLSSPYGMYACPRQAANGVPAVEFLVGVGFVANLSVPVAASAGGNSVLGARGGVIS